MTYPLTSITKIIIIDNFDEEAPFVDTAAIIENLDLIIVIREIVHLTIIKNNL